MCLSLHLQLQVLPGLPQFFHHLVEVVHHSNHPQPCCLGWLLRRRCKICWRNPKNRLLCSWLIVGLRQIPKPLLFCSLLLCSLLLCALLLCGLLLINVNFHVLFYSGRVIEISYMVEPTAFSCESAFVFKKFVTGTHCMVVFPVHHKITK